MTRTSNPMNLGSIIGSLPTEEITIKRRSEGRTIDGIYREGRDTTLRMDAIVYPPEPRDLQNLEEGLNTREPLCFVTKDPLFVTETGVSGEDFVVRNGRRYEIKQVRPFIAQAGFYWSMGFKVDETVRR